MRHSRSTNTTHQLRAPPPQRPVELALEAAFETLRSQPPTQKKLAALGAALIADGIRLRVLDRYFIIKPESCEVLVQNSGKARPEWAVLAVQYLCAKNLSFDSREVSLAHFSDCLLYVGPFTKRVIGRFLKAFGRSTDSFVEASKALGGIAVPSSGTAYCFQVLPRVPITLVLFPGDDEFGPNANVIFRADAQNLLHPGTIIAAAELLVGALCGSTLETT